ncbi:MAG: amino acid ABC transporter ATP-binding protein [Verrucomicrobiales bacterium]|nr:amino acid ABC transporter ATP-binding protein [Verrucomicrobiales bacterium]
MKIETVELSKTYGATKAVDGVSLSLEGDVQVLAMIGPSGSGKSTFLRLIGGLEVPTTGIVKIDGQPLPSEEAGLREVRRGNGFLFQSFNLFPHLTALENIVLPLAEVYGRSRAQATERAEEVVERFRLTDHVRKQPGQLSGGQQQRIALARAMAHDPALLLLDEPTSALDPEMKAEVLDLIAELCESGQQIILSTHEMGFAKGSADHVVFLAEGRCIEDAPSKDLFESPATETVSCFLEKVMKW